MSVEREAVAARVLIEERWAYIARERGVSFDELATLSGAPVSKGGLGRQIGAPTLKRRVRAYLIRRRARLEAAREEERQRRIDDAELVVDRHDRKLAASASDPTAYAAALRAYERAEARLMHEEAGAHVPLTRQMRQSDEIDVALALVEAMRHVAGDERPHLARSLSIQAPLAAFAARLRV